MRFTINCEFVLLDVCDKGKRERVGSACTLWWLWRAHTQGGSKVFFFCRAIFLTTNVRMLGGGME